MEWFQVLMEKEGYEDALRKTLTSIAYFNNWILDDAEEHLSHKALVRVALEWSHVTVPDSLTEYAGAMAANSYSRRRSCDGMYSTVIYNLLLHSRAVPLYLSGEGSVEPIKRMNELIRLEEMYKYLFKAFYISFLKGETGFAAGYSCTTRQVLDFIDGLGEDILPPKREFSERMRQLDDEARWKDTEFKVCASNSDNYSLKGLRALLERFDGVSGEVVGQFLNDCFIESDFRKVIDFSEIKNFFPGKDERYVEGVANIKKAIFANAVMRPNVHAYIGYVKGQNDTQPRIYLSDKCKKLLTACVFAINDQMGDPTAVSLALDDLIGLFDRLATHPDEGIRLEFLVV